MRNGFLLGRIFFVGFYLLALLALQVSPEVRAASWDQERAQSHSLSLQQAYELARKRGGFEVLEVSRLRVDLAHEQLRQARGQMLPQIDFSYRLLQQDIPDSGAQTFSSAFREPRQTTSRLTLRQPLFRGLGEYRAMELAQLVKSQEEQAYTQAEVDLFVDVLKRFVAVLKAEKERSTLAALVRSLEQREAELRRRVEIGRSRPADLLSAQAQKALAEAELLDVEVQLQVARRYLRESLYGADAGPQEVKMELEGLALPGEALPSLEGLLAELERAPRFQALSLRLGAARKEVSLRRAARLPRLDFEANYYFVRPGVLRDSQWDGALLLSWPLFSGGILRSQVAEVTIKQEQEELELARRLRQAQLELEAAYAQLVAQLEGLKLLEKAVALSQKSFQQILAEYRSGLVTYLEVYQAETAYYQARRSFDRTRLQAQGQRLELEAQVGRIAVIKN